MKHKCTACGHEDEINPGKLLGAIRTPKREAAWKRHGERLKTMFANARKLSSIPVIPIPRQTMTREQLLAANMDSAFVDTVAPPPMDTRVMDKGSLTKDDLKALIAGGAKRSPNTDKCPHGVEIKYNCPECQDYEIWGNTPHAPFDFNDEEGNPHRVRAYGKQLKVCFLRDGAEEPIRNLGEGELEGLWERRIK